MNTENNGNEEPEVINTTEARQGRRGFPLRVLVISLVLIVGAFLIVYSFAEMTDRDQPAGADPEPEITEIEPPPNVPPAE